MKAAAVTAPGRVEVVEIADPLVGPFDVVCEALVGSVCAGTDTHVIEGTFGPAGFPKIIGHETVGRVVEVGREVRNFAEGNLVTRVGAPPSEDYVLAWGGMVQFPVAKDHRAMREKGLPQQEWWSHRINQVIPEGLLAVRHTSMFITWRETLSYLQRAGLGSARRVIVSGSGANGMSMAALLRALGCEEVVMIGSASRRDRCSGFTDRYLDYRSVGEIEEFMRSAAGRFDGVIDATGVSGSLDAALPALREDAIVGVYGLDDGDGYFFRPMRAKSFRFYNSGYDEAETHGQVIDLVARGLLDARCWVDAETFGWHSVADAFQAARDRSIVKPVIDLTEDQEWNS